MKLIIFKRKSDQNPYLLEKKNTQENYEIKGYYLVIENKGSSDAGFESLIKQKSKS